MSQSNSNIYPKNCVYGCNTRIYWNTSGLLDLLVYCEVPEGKRDEVKRRFEFIKNTPTATISPAV